MTNPGAKIKYLRQLANMSQEELGKRVGVQRAAINKYEKGSVTNIPISTIEKMAVVFDVSPTYILGWDHQPCDHLSAEVKILQGVERFYGNDVVELIENYQSLDANGKKRVQQYLDDLVMVYHAKGSDVLM